METGINHLSVNPSVRPSVCRRCNKLFTFWLIYQAFWLKYFLSYVWTGLIRRSKKKIDDKDHRCFLLFEFLYCRRLGWHPFVHVNVGFMLLILYKLIATEGFYTLHIWYRKKKADDLSHIFDDFFETFFFILFYLH